MKIPRPPFHNAIAELIYALIVGGDCIGYENVAVDSSAIAELNPPARATYGLMIVEADPTAADKSKLLRIKENGVPTSLEGLPLGELTVYEVSGKNNLKNFRAIGIEAGIIHSLKIHYYS